MPGWHEVFAFGTPPLEIFLRGSITYLFIFALLRVVLKRETGQLGVADILVLVLIADAAQNGMAGTYTSVTDGLILVSTLVFWAWFLDWLAFRYRWLERLMYPKPKAIVRDGEPQASTMRSEFMTVEELARQLRQQGVDDVSKVKVAYIEPDGRVSVIKREQH
jgi:uncharacterized membrane protein YcaP (DUF421 family)